MKRHSEADKAWLVQEWEQSGKSKWAFAKELGLHYQPSASGHPVRVTHGVDQALSAHIAIGRFPFGVPAMQAVFAAD
jgi:hypothetical protein